MVKWIKFNRNSMATEEDWETVCEAAGCDTNVDWVKFYIADAEYYDGESEVIQDVHAEWHGETGTVMLFAETREGEYIYLHEFMPESKPTFANEDIDIDASDYTEYYNIALKEAHKQGFILAAEKED